MSLLQRLQSWYLKQCNGDWEHDSEITIQTLDNPGWLMQINLQGTSAEQLDFPRIKIERSEHDWMHASRTGDIIKLACGPENLDEMLRVFLDWAGA